VYNNKTYNIFFVNQILEMFFLINQMFFFNQMFFLDGFVCQDWILPLVEKYNFLTGAQIP